MNFETNFFEKGINNTEESSMVEAKEGITEAEKAINSILGNFFEEK